MKLAAVLVSRRLLLVFALTAIAAPCFGDNLADLIPLTQAQKCELFALDPQNRNKNPDDNGYFFGFKIIRSVFVGTAGTATIAANMMGQVQAWEKGDKAVAACFEPRHAVEVKVDEDRYDYIICYQCDQIEIYKNGQQISGAGIKGSPEIMDSFFAPDAKLVPYKASRGLPRTSSPLDLFTPAPRDLLDKLNKNE